MKALISLLTVLLMFWCGSAWAGGHDTGRAIEAPKGQQPESDRPKRVAEDQAPRGGKPKPKPKPPKESDEKGGTEDLNIGLGELQE